MKRKIEETSKSTSSDFEQDDKKEAATSNDISKPNTEHSVPQFVENDEKTLQKNVKNSEKECVNFAKKVKADNKSKSFEKMYIKLDNSLDFSEVKKEKKSPSSLDNTFKTEIDGYFSTESSFQFDGSFLEKDYLENYQHGYFKKQSTSKTVTVNFGLSPKDMKNEKNVQDFNFDFDNSIPLFNDEKISFMNDTNSTNVNNSGLSKSKLNYFRFKKILKNSKFPFKRKNNTSLKSSVLLIPLKKGKNSLKPSLIDKEKLQKLQSECEDKRLSYIKKSNEFEDIENEDFDLDSKDFSLTDTSAPFALTSTINDVNEEILSAFTFEERKNNEDLIMRTRKG